MSEANESETQSLYSLVTQTNILTQEIIERGGELSPEIELALQNISLAVAEKVDGYAVVMDRMDFESDYWKAKADLYSRIARTHAAIKDRLKENLKAAMIKMDTKEVEGNDIRFVLTTAKAALVIEDGAAIPKGYTDEIIERVINKERLREALEHGQEIPGAALKVSHSLRKYPAKRGKK